MKKIIFLFVILFFACSISYAQKKTLVGSWKIDEQLSDFGGLKPEIAVPFVLKVSIKKDSIMIKRVLSTREEFEQRLSIKGDTLESVNKNGNTMIFTHIVSPFKPDQMTLLNDFEVNGNEWRYSRREDWSLSNDGKTLTILRVTALPDKVDKVKGVYHREKATQ